MKKTVVAALTTLGALLMIAACSKDSAPSSEHGSGTEKATPVAAAAITPAAMEMFKTRCAACHGETGEGNGPGSAALNPKPRNYHDKAWQAKVTDDDIKKTIVYGGAAVGKSPMMPASPDLDSKPEIVSGLLQIVRSFGK